MPAVLAGILILLVGSSATAAQTDAVPEASVGADRLVPDVVLVAVGGAEASTDEVVDRLEAVDGVTRVTREIGADPDAVFVLALDEGSGSRPLAAVTAAAEEVVADVAPGEVLVGGRAVVDDTIDRRFARSAGVVAWLAVLLGLPLGLVFGWHRAGAAAVIGGVAVAAAASLGAQIGDADGSMAGSALPAALAALAVSTTLVVRLLAWFRHPAGDDGAARIRSALAALVPELAIVGAGLVAASVVVDLLDPGRSALTVVTVGVATAAVVVAAALPPVLTVLDAMPSGPLAGAVPVDVPDGRDLTLPVVAAGVVTLALLSIAALGRVADPLLAEGDLPDGDPAVAVSDTLARLGGDPTAAIVVRPPVGATGDLAAWAAETVERADVARIDLPTVRLTSIGSSSELAERDLLVPPGVDDVALLVPAVSPRSAEGQALVDALADGQVAGMTPILEGPSAAGSAAAGSRVPVLLTVLAIAAISAVGALVLTGNRAVAAVAFLVRLVAGGTAVGLMNLLAGRSTMAAATTVVAAVGVVAVLADLEFLRRVDAESDPSPHVRPAAVGRGRPDPDLAPGWPGNPGQFAAIGMAALVPAGLAVAVTALVGGGPGTGALGTAVLVAALLETVVVAGVLRPALLGQGPAFHTAARPLRVAVHGRTTGPTRNASDADDDPAWRRVVEDLLDAEFRLQLEPGDADLVGVFVTDTPVHRQAARHHANLAGAGLRVVGRRPRLQALHTVRAAAPVMVMVTVDHPERRLLDRTGRVVGVRAAERRSGLLWLSAGLDGAYRIVESVELGSEPIETSTVDVRVPVAEVTAPPRVPA